MGVSSLSSAYSVSDRAWLGSLPQKGEVQDCVRVCVECVCVCGKRGGGWGGKEEDNRANVLLF